MAATAEGLSERRLRELSEENCAVITRQFPEAVFRIYPNAKDRSAIVEAFTDAGSAFDVLDLVSERLVDILVEEDIDIHVHPFPRNDPRAADGQRVPSGTSQR